MQRTSRVPEVEQAFSAVRETLSRLGASLPVVTDAQVYLVEWHDERDGNRSQLGGFTTLQQAEACRAMLTGEGLRGLLINIVPIHNTIEDWSADR